jgi:hypothetical protein
MVTDKKAFVSTSNWIGDYFLTTAGASFVTDHPQVCYSLDFPCITLVKVAGHDRDLIGCGFADGGWASGDLLAGLGQ